MDLPERDGDGYLTDMSAWTPEIGRAMAEADGVELDDLLADRIRRKIRDNTSPRHVPARIVCVTDVPRTISGKISELAVREVIHGRADAFLYDRHSIVRHHRAPSIG